MLAPLLVALKVQPENKIRIKTKTKNTIIINR
jgi:hypothetical protein